MYIYNFKKKFYKVIRVWGSNYTNEILPLMKISLALGVVVYDCELPIYIFNVIYGTNSICLLLDRP